ncbi:MAG: hypothetical protein PHQ40_07835, partial [Anaerolineaceae bacterium]|nr:hypothetical protein [Anaerolineaceae bacterium]
MRITRDALLKLARETASMRVRQDRSIVAIYLVGSLLTEEPLLGGSTDIDLVMVHDSQQPVEREIVRLSDEIHLDIAHHSQAIYEQPRLLRVDAWLGPAVHDHPVLLYDRQHWFEFTQASAGSQFNRPDYVMGRARPLAEAARQGWLRLHTSSPGELSPAETAWTYLRALEQASNAVASLSGAPLTERRFLGSFAQRVQAVGQSGLDTGLAGLLGEHLVDADTISSWLPAWEQDFSAAGSPEGAPARLHPARLAYYQRGIQAWLGSEQPGRALWSLLTTWTLAATCLAAGSLQLAAWEEAIRQLHLGMDDLSERVEALDA